MKIKARTYRMWIDENGNENHFETMSVSGQALRPQPSFFARVGKFPNYNPVVDESEAISQMQKFFSNRSAGYEVVSVENFNKVAGGVYKVEHIDCTEKSVNREKTRFIVEYIYISE